MLKAKLVGTAFGQFMLGIKQWQALRFLPYANPEAASACANAILADRLVTHLCPAGGVFLDVGAHIGSVFSSVHRLNPTTTILAVEADPDKAHALKRRFPYASIMDVAVGEQDGSVDFFRDQAKSGFNSLLPNADTNGNKITVRLARLDDLVTGHVDLIKMDVEGAELGALRGAEDLIARCRPVIMFESTSVDKNALGYSASALWDWLHARDYGVFVPDRLAHEAQQMGLETFLDSHAYPFRTLNYFAVPQERRVVVRDRAREILGISV